ncbi:hypothetical protein SLA2020_148540 [Shorea laevis]
MRIVDYVKAISIFLLTSRVVYVQHGGRTNAFTASESTNFHFDVNIDGFQEALDRFAQIFIKPLMSADATMREIKAVDSENKKNLLSDVWRMSQLQRHISMEGHLYHKFSAGNWDTLELCTQKKVLIKYRACFPGQPCSAEHLQILVRAVPIKEGNKLRIVWPITPAIHFYKEWPCGHLGHLIGHEGEGSLFYVLKKLGWAAGVYEIIKYLKRE